MQSVTDKEESEITEPDNTNKDEHEHTHLDIPEKATTPSPETPRKKKKHRKRSKSIEPSPALEKIVNELKSDTSEKTDVTAVEHEEPVEDEVLSLEKILSTELANFSATNVTWQTSPDKKYKLCIFYVR